jgi:hypothetical protein
VWPVTDPSGFDSRTRLTFHGPLSAERADRLAAELAASGPETATLTEWDEFESGLATGAEEWLLANPDHPEAGAVRDRLDTHRSIWLRGHRDVMGFAYLTLGAA